MGHVYAEITLQNPRMPDLSPLTVSAMVDTGAMMLCIPEHIALQLQLETHNMREVTVADGRRQMVPYVGPIEVRFENRNCYVGALVLGGDVLLGAIPMEDMDVVISPLHRKIVVNPDSPNFAHAMVKVLADGGPGGRRSASRGHRRWWAGSPSREAALIEGRRPCEG